MTENGDFDFPIHRAVWYADLERLSQLLCDEEIKTQVNDFDHHGNTPLHIATHFGDVEAVNLLLENGADPYLKDNDGVSTLKMSHYNPIMKELIGKSYRSNMREEKKESSKDHPTPIVCLFNIV